MSMLAAPDTITGPLRAEDLDRATNPGNVWHLHRAVVQPAGLDQQGRRTTRRFGHQADFVDTIATDFGGLRPAEACTELGADDCRPPVTRLGVALIVLPWVLGVIGWAVWMRWPL